MRFCFKIHTVTKLAYLAQTVLHQSTHVVGFVVESFPVDCLPVEKEILVECSVVDFHIGRRETDLVVDCFVVDCRMGIRGKDLPVVCCKPIHYLVMCCVTLFRMNCL